MRILAVLIVVAMMIVTPAGTRAARQAPEDGSEEKLREFVPSEEIPADSAISFPVDI